MTDDRLIRELKLRSDAAAALRYERPDAAQRPVLDTSHLWAPTEPPPADPPGEPDRTPHGKPD